MIKVFALLSEVIMWLGLAASPILGSLLVVLLITIITNDFNLYLTAFFVSAGAIVGIRWAEKVRRGMGLSHFYGRLLGAGKK
jgi:hypothetical protein